MQTLAYKPNAAETVERLSSLWSRRARDRIFARMNVPSPPLEEFERTHEDGPAEYPDPRERIDFWDRHLEAKAKVEDDWMPIAYLSEFDEGLYAALSGAEIRYMMHSGIGWVSSMSPPCLDDLSKVDELRIDPGHPMIKILDRQLEIFRERARGKFGVAPPIVIDAMNFVAELRGMTQAFYDVMDHPDETIRLMNFAYDLNVFVQERIQKSLDTFAGGSFVNMGSWAPGTPILFSVDFYHMAEPDYFEEWGRPYIQPLLDHFGGGLLHLHSNGRHLLPSVRTMPGLVCVLLLDEDWSERAYDKLPEYHATADGVPLVIHCRWEEFVRDLDAKKLPGNVLYDIVEVPSEDGANRVMEKVRTYQV